MDGQGSEVGGKSVFQSGGGTWPPPSVAAAAAVGTRLYWYRARAARPQGPLRMERLRELWLQGGLDAHSLIWCEAWPHWKPVCQVPELSAGVPRAHRPPSLTPAYSLAA